MMNLEALQACCLEKPGTAAEFPFGPEVVVFKVRGKMFALTQNDPTPASVSVKAHPDDALALRAYFKSITPGYHLNKKHWITIELDGDVPEEELINLIEDSYRLVVLSLPAAERKNLQLGHPPTSQNPSPGD